jgi:hypothetical protein
VINRVYLVKTVDVSLFSNRGFGAGGSAGVPQPVQLLNIANATEAAKQFAAVNDILSNAISPTTKNAAAPLSAAEEAGSLPVAVGGTVKLAMATSRSVSLVETFRRPTGNRLSGLGLRDRGARQVRFAGSHTGRP